jgi:quinol monooxygenase YgiN
VIAVTARLRARHGEEQTLAAALRALAQAVRAEEPGCLLYRVARSKHDPQLFVVLERYRDDEALAAHANSAHYCEAVPALLDLLEERPEIALFDELEADA